MQNRNYIHESNQEASSYLKKRELLHFVEKI
jgi:hypothetical protein